jgi:hypothetical protein
MYYRSTRTGESQWGEGTLANPNVKHFAYAGVHTWTANQKDAVTNGIDKWDAQTGKINWEPRQSANDGVGSISPYSVISRRSVTDLDSICRPATRCSSSGTLALDGELVQWAGTSRRLRQQQRRQHRQAITCSSTATTRPTGTTTRTLTRQQRDRPLERRDARVRSCDRVRWTLDPPTRSATTTVIRALRRRTTDDVRSDGCGHQVRGNLAVDDD